MENLKEKLAWLAQLLAVDSQFSGNDLIHLAELLKIIRVEVTKKESQDFVGSWLVLNFSLLMDGVISEKVREDEKIQLFLLQFLTNTITKHSTNKKILMKKLFEELNFSKFKKFLDQLDKPKLVKTLAIFCYNFQCDLDADFLRQTYNNQNFLALLQKIFSFYLTHPTIPSNDELLEWIYLLLSLLFSLPPSILPPPSLLLSLPSSPLPPPSFSSLSSLSSSFLPPSSSPSSSLPPSSFLPSSFVSPFSSLLLSPPSILPPSSLLLPSSSSLLLLFLLLDKAQTIRLLLLLFQIFSQIIDNREQSTLIREEEERMKLVEDIFQSQKTNLFKVVMLKSDDLEFLADVYKGEVEGMMRSVAEGKRIEVNEHFAIVHIILKILILITNFGGYQPSIQKTLMDRQVFKRTLEFLKFLNNLKKQKKEDEQGKKMEGGGKLKLEEEIKKEEEERRKEKAKKEEGGKKEENGRREGGGNKEGEGWLYDCILDQEVRFEIFTHLLRFFCNMTHINKEAHEFVLKEDYLLLLLGFTNLDEENPLMKEWSIFLIRNLTENNDAIQKRISQLKVIDMDSQTKEFLKKYKYQG